MDKPLPALALPDAQPRTTYLDTQSNGSGDPASPRPTSYAPHNFSRKPTVDRKPVGGNATSPPQSTRNSLGQQTRTSNANARTSMTPSSDGHSIASRDLETPEPGHYRTSTYSIPPTQSIPIRQTHIRDPSESIAPSEAAELSSYSTPAASTLGGDAMYSGQGETRDATLGAADQAQAENYAEPQLQYFHKPYAQEQRKASPVPELHLPDEHHGRPGSAITVGSGSDGSRGRHRSHLSVGNGSASPGGSPMSHARDQSKHRYSPNARPMSYVDLLNVPYPQQVAPATNLDNSFLRTAVGNNASLLDQSKTLELYKANVKKTSDPAVQYEFAIFMVQTAMDIPPDSKGPNSREDMLKEARQFLHKLADRSYPFAQYYLGDGFSSGLFNKGKEDYDRAFPLFVAASKHGHAEAGYRAALCYEFGWGCRKDFAKAVQFYRASASKNHPGAATRLGMACLEGTMGLTNHYKEGIKWLKRATESADMQYNAAPYELGRLHENGYGEDVFKDEVYAAQLFTQSADLGHADANLVMGKAYEYGMLKCPKDAALSIHFYNGAAQAGIPEAMMALCAWYLFGAEPILAKDENEAFEWAKRAADQGKQS